MTWQDNYNLYRITWRNSTKQVSIKEFKHTTGPTTIIPDTPLGIFHLFFTLEILQYIVDETNRYALQCMGETEFTAWQKVTVPELERCSLGPWSWWDSWGSLPWVITGKKIQRTTTHQLHPASPGIGFMTFKNTSISQTMSSWHQLVLQHEAILKMLTERFESVFNLHKELSVDEAMKRWFHSRADLPWNNTSQWNH